MTKAVAIIAVLYTIGTGLRPVLGNASLVASTSWGLPQLLAGASVAVLTVRMATR